MAALKVFVQHLEAIDTSIANLDRRIASAHARSEASRLLAGIPGVGKITASAIVASVPDPNAFKSGRDFSAWLGSTPRQNSSGGKEKLGSITKQGNAYIRRLLVLGATSLLRRLANAKGHCTIGSSRFSRAGPRGSSRWRLPTSLPGSHGHTPSV